jgi:hypothetical protein
LYPHYEFIHDLIAPNQDSIHPSFDGESTNPHARKADKKISLNGTPHVTGSGIPAVQFT